MSTMSRCKAQDYNIETHENENPIRVRFPVLDHLLVLFRRHFQIHRKDIPGTIRKIRYILCCLSWRRLGWIVLVASYVGSGGK